MAYERDSTEDLVWDESSSQYIPAASSTTVVLTVNPIPADATVVLIANGATQSGNTIEVTLGTEVTYTISKTGFDTKTGKITPSETSSVSIRIWPIDKALHIQILRGTHDENLDYTGSLGELTMDTDLNQIRLHDGETVGGHVIGGGGSYTAGAGLTLSGSEFLANLVTSVSSSSTDNQIPTAKLFYDTCGDIESLINAL